MRRGYCFVKFDHGRYAEDAIRNLDGTFHLGKTICVEFTKSDKTRRSPIKRNRSNDLDSRERYRHISRSYHDNRDNYSNSLHRSRDRCSPYDQRVEFKRGSSRERCSPHYDNRHETKRELSFKKGKRRRYSSSSDSDKSKSKSPILKRSASSSRSITPPAQKAPKLGLVQRLRLKAELEKRVKEIEDGEILSDIENWPIKSLGTVSTACEVINGCSSTSTMINLEKRKRLFDADENSKNVSNSFGSDSSEETDSELLKAYASPPSEREESLEINAQPNGQDAVVVQSS